MLLLIHIAVAFASIGYSAWVFFFPTITRLHVAYHFIAATLGTGTALVFLHPESLPQACVSGLMYVALQLGATLLIRRRLSTTR